LIAVLAIGEVLVMGKPKHRFARFCRSLGVAAATPYLESAWLSHTSLTWMKKLAFPLRTWQIIPAMRQSNSRNGIGVRAQRTVLGKIKMSNKLRFGLPKGSLQEATIEKMAKAGFNIQVSSRSYIPYVDDDELEIRLIRAQEISRYVEHGYLDCGITGYDWIIENGSKVHEVGEFLFSKVSRRPARWVLCVPENSPVKSVKDLEGKRIATEVVNLTRAYLKKNGVTAEVEFSWGATEVKAHELVDAIVEVTETGSSLRANKLRIVDELLSSTPRLIANHTAWKDSWKRKKIETLSLLLKGALDAESKVGLKMNIAEKNVKSLLKNLPALRNPTISNLSLKGWVAVETIIDEHIVRELIPQLKAAGAEGIIEYPLNKVVY
jgi:ATP phosphoribosyltransferase